MLQPGMYSEASTTYRFGFNGMLRDDDVKDLVTTTPEEGVGNSYATQFRLYDPRTTRWFSLDPLRAKFPSVSPYVGMGNNPVSMVDPFGSEGSDQNAKHHTTPGVEVWADREPDSRAQGGSSYINPDPFFESGGVKQIGTIDGLDFFERRNDLGEISEYQLGRNGNPEIAFGSKDLKYYTMNAKEWKYKLDWAEIITSNTATREELLFGDKYRASFLVWKEQVTNPFNWIMGASIYAHSLPTLNMRPNLPKTYLPPTNPPQYPPTNLGPNFSIRVMRPTVQYLDGYWKLFRQFEPGKWEPINPTTMKSGNAAETHIPLPTRVKILPLNPNIDKK